MRLLSREKHFNIFHPEFVFLQICDSVCACWVASVVSGSFWPYGPCPARLLCPWDSPGKNTGVGCHALLQGVFPRGSIIMPILTVTLWACIQIVADLKTNVNSFFFQLTRLGNLELYLLFSFIVPLFKLSTFYFLLLSHAIQYIHTSVYVCIYIYIILCMYIYTCVYVYVIFSVLRILFI